MTPETIHKLLGRLTARERLEFAEENFQITAAIDAGIVESAKNGDKAAFQKLISVAERVTSLQHAWAMSVAIRCDEGFVAQMAEADARWESGDRDTISVDDLERLLLY